MQMINSRLPRLAAVVALAASVLLLAGCERPPVETSQQGFRGTGMQNTVNPRIAAKDAAARPTPPEDAPPASADGPRAGQIYQNVKVLGGLSVAEFNRHMNAITQWVSPEQGCNYCHNGANFADDSKYTKVVARRMIEMTQALNSQWKVHTGATGVTCYTCHRGQPVPANMWFKPMTPVRNASLGGALGNDFGQNKADGPGVTSLPRDPYSSYLLGDEQVKVYGKEPLPQGIGNGAPIQQAEKTYALMMHFSKGLGQNCTFCHNSQNFGSWVPKKVTAWHGIRMERDINNTYVVPLTDAFPKDRLGPQGDIGKAYCATCHQGQNKPLGGLQMAKLYDGLQVLAPPVAALPPPVTEEKRSVLFFGVGSHEMAPDQGRGLETLLTALGSSTRSVVLVSGYHSAAGEKAANEELAKKRAFAVRDALLAAGVAPARVKLDKPQQAEANVAGEDPAARRVEVRLQ
jgi:photosynthetic reaction center cytochrome c subunit